MPVAAVKAVSLALVALFVFGVVVQLRTWRKAKRVRPVFVVVSQASALLGSIVFSVVTGRPPEAGMWMLLLGAGVVFGLAYGGFVRVERGERGVMMGYTLPWIVTWACLLAVTQLSAVFAQSVPLVIWSLAIVNLGVNLGMNGRILSGYRAALIPSGTSVLLVAALVAALAAGLLLGGPAATAQEAGDSFEFGSVAEVPSDLAFAVVLGGGEFLGGRVTYGSGEGGEPLVRLEYGVRVTDLESYSEPAGGEGVAGLTPVEGLRETEADLLVDIRWYATQSEAEAAFAARAPDPAWRRLGHKSWDPEFTPQIATGVDLPVLDYTGPETQQTRRIVLVRFVTGSAYVEWLSDLGGYGSGAPCSHPEFQSPCGDEQLVPLAAALEGSSVSSQPPSGEPGSATTQPGTQGTAETPGTPEAPGDPGAPQDEEDLTDERVAAALALANLILAAGSATQVLQTVPGGGGSPGPAPAPPPAAHPPAGDGQVWYQPPWEEGGPIPMDADWVREIEDRQRRGYRWTRHGWSTDRQIAMREQWDAAQQAAEAREREEFLREQQEARDRLARRRDALDYVEKATDAAIDRLGVDRYGQLVEQISEQAYNEDGSVNVEYVGRLRKGLGTMLRRDLEIPDESLRHDWVADFASSTWEDARHSALIRIGAGVLSSGLSEGYYQSQGLYDAMQTASEQSDEPLTLADGLRTMYGTIAEETLPITTVRKLVTGEEVTVYDVLGDVFKGANLRSQVKGIKAEHVPDDAGLVAWQRRAVQSEATTSGVQMKFRKVNPGRRFKLVREKNLPGKQPWMKQKSIDADDVKYLGYDEAQLGRVPSGPPKPPSGFADADEYRKAVAHYEKRSAEWSKAGSATQDALEAGTVADVDGALYSVDPVTGKPAKPFVSDLDPADMMTVDGRRLTDAEVVDVMKRLEERGLASGNHGTPYTWDLPEDSPLQGMKADLIAKIEGGDHGGWFVPDGTAGARPPWTAGAVGAGIQDAGGGP
ncbi:MAG: hypothetical protein KQH83_06330 [Actinobacteria bacterium]|nr:hypothetical protein [Actinomycetota bacterium]